MAKKQESGNLKITLVKSTIACKDKQIKTVEALGLKKIGSEKVLPDTPVTQGMIDVVRHLVKVEQL
ncbi:MAG: 50S ribosomal protein L30 [Firmicutes bacterium]|nr:50S ribosomal protein L30 [Bacillota bacterium]